MKPITNSNLFSLWDRNKICTTRLDKFVEFFGGSKTLSVWAKWMSVHTIPNYHSVQTLVQAIWVCACRTLTLAKWGGWSPTLGKVGIWSPPRLPNVQSSTTRPKTPCIKVFLMSLKTSWNVDIENGLALAIWTLAAQVMGKRRVGSQTGSLTFDH
jgi:hypothetical protein